jgi:hypothetical protein
MTPKNIPRTAHGATHSQDDPTRLTVASAEAAATPLQRTASHGPHDHVALITMLQRGAGNAAVSRLLARRSAAALAREPAPTPEPESSDPPECVPTEMTEVERTRWERETAGHVLGRKDDFDNACAAHRDALRAEARARAEAAAMLVDVATAFLAPAYTRCVTGMLLKEVTAKLDPGLVKSFQSFMLDADFVKAEFTMATKEFSAVAKINAMALFGETSQDALLTSAQRAFSTHVEDLNDSLGDMSDERLMAVWWAYSDENKNVDVYREAIAEMLAQCEQFIDAQGSATHEIGQGPMPSGDVVDLETRVYLAPVHGGVFPILVRTSDIHMGSPRHEFRGYVPAALEDSAKARTEELFGEVTTIDPSSLDSEIPPPPPPQP